jgi:hypothetical protein
LSMGKQWRSGNGPAPENDRKKIWGAWSIAPVKKKKNILKFFLKWLPKPFYSLPITK